jgi:hypothetical protein
VLAHGQQMAITFDDLPAHGEKPAGTTRLGIVQSILATLKQQQPRQKISIHQWSIPDLGVY